MTVIKYMYFNYIDKQDIIQVDEGEFMIIYFDKYY